MRVFVVLAGMAALTGCGPKAESLGRFGGSAPSLLISTRLLTAGGDELGTVQVMQEKDGTRVIAEIKGLPPGEYALHLHSVGACTGPDFTSAGPHFNPDARQHGRDNPMGAHAGDLPNLIVSASGIAMLDALQPGLKLAEGTAPLLDADGAAVVLHARPDDYRSDPAGNAGARIACGVLRRGIPVRP
ncbi:superoxide dismutase family protein [Sandarakinorhabdus sp.]|uniref:superoxide dismutase family protein n=1 Tax=Sandarakinorhabdus sp. TaxID=1916663 RepID=UPI00286E9DC4|nr:superoxide dismutase family protein [Sandarakinorhabdus sp.]